jgi:glycosyltransferase involved in cell wall biosynthesis
MIADADWNRRVPCGSSIANGNRNRYRLYSRGVVEQGFFGSTSNYEFRVIPFPRVWTHSRLSLELLAHAPDILWVPAHVLPLIHPHRSFVTIHDLGHLHFPDAHPAIERSYHNWALWWNTRAETRIFVDSESTQGDLSHFFGVPSEKITVVYPGYDEQSYRPFTERSIIEATKNRYRIGMDYILSVGTIHPRKNYSRLIEAFERTESGNIGLVIVGKRGWRSDSIVEQVNRSNLRSQISLLDYVPSVDLPALVAGARLLAFPSLYEGFGLPILEAQACGTPVTCSMTSSLPEAAGDAALFFDPLDADAIAGAMQRLLTDTLLREKLIARGFENIRRFSWRVSASRVLKAFGDCQ